MSNLYSGPSIDASYQVSVHLAKRFRGEDFKNRPIRNKNCLWWPVSDTGSVGLSPLVSVIDFVESFSQFRWNFSISYAFRGKFDRKRDEKCHFSHHKTGNAISNTIKKNQTNNLKSNKKKKHQNWMKNKNLNTSKICNNYIN
jgi:hypothetical protein